MNLTFTSQEIEWREEVRDFLRNELPAEYARTPEFEEDDDYWTFAWEFTRKVAGKGWIGLTWPKEYGGLERPAIERFIMGEEFAYHRAPFINQIGWGGVAGGLLYGGTEEQKRRFLPPIARMETFWVEGFSEPGAGSDLASLTTRADRNGSSWVVNGQKTYTTFGTHGDVIYLAARTNQEVPRHRGITMFCVPLDAPGVFMTPLDNIGGGRQNHTFLENVMIGQDMMIGEEGWGWQMIMNGFYGNAGAGAGFAEDMRLLHDLTDYCLVTERGGRLLCEDPVIEDNLAELTLLVEAERLLAYESVGLRQASLKPKYAGALGTVVNKENMPRIAELVNGIVGPLGQLTQGSRWAPIDGMPEAWYRWSLKTHAGGASQVKRMVLATRGLGLPR